MNDTDTVEVTIGGAVLTVPPMSFYVLRRARPHIGRIAQMSRLSGKLIDVTRRLEAAKAADPPEPEEHLRALQDEQATAMQEVDTKGADFVSQTDEALHVIAEALAAGDPPGASYDALSRRMRPDEMAGLHVAFNKLLEVSGLLASGERGTGGDGLDAAEAIEWDRFIAELVAYGIEGGSWDAVERRMTIPRYRALHRHWRRYPRPEWLIAGYLGYRPPPEMSPLAALARRGAHSPPQPAQAAGRRAVSSPPTGELQSLFRSLGGAPGRTVVVAR